MKLEISLSLSGRSLSLGFFVVGSFWLRLYFRYRWEEAG